METTRIYTGEDGETHFEDVTVEVTPVDFAPPAPPVDLASPVAAERMILGSVPAGWLGDWHPAPARQFVFILSGELEVSVSDGDVRTFSAGDVVLLEDTAGKGHRTRVVGESEARLAFVQLA